MFPGLVDLVLHPDRFFLRVSQEKVNLIPPLIIIGTGLFAILLSIIIPLVFLSLNHPDRIGYVGWMGLIQFHLRCTISLPLITWAIMSLGTYAISRVLEGRGTLTATTQNTGFGMIPWTIGVLAMIGISAVLFVIALAVPPSLIPLEDYAPNMYASFPLISFFVLIWEVYLWILAVKYTQGFSYRKAAAVTAIPVLIVILLMVPVLAWYDTIMVIISGT